MRSTILIAAIATCTAVAFLIVDISTPSKKQIELAKTEQAQRLQTNADDIVGGIQYIKDPRTGLCFADYWGGGIDGGPSLTTVPCDAIPLKLLTMANPSNR